MNDSNSTHEDHMIRLGLDFEILDGSEWEERCTSALTAAPNTASDHPCEPNGKGAPDAAK